MFLWYITLADFCRCMNIFKPVVLCKFVNVEICFDFTYNNVVIYFILFKKIALLLVISSSKDTADDFTQTTKHHNT